MRHVIHCVQDLATHVNVLEATHRQGCYCSIGSASLAIDILPQDILTSVQLPPDGVRSLLKAAALVHS